MQGLACANQVPWPIHPLCVYGSCPLPLREPVDISTERAVRVHCYQLPSVGRAGGYFHVQNLRTELERLLKDLPNDWARLGHNHHVLPKAQPSIQI